MVNMQDNFSSYIAQLKSKHKDTVFNPLFFNGSLQDTDEPDAKPIHLFVIMADPSEIFIKAVTLNLQNPKIETITLFTNFDESEPLSHEKLKYVKYSKHFGLQLSDITCHFKENEINVFMYDIILLDLDSTLYLHYLTNTQLGLLSAKTFNKEIPDAVYKFKNASVYNNSNTEFNALVVLGKLQDYDLYLDMYGSLNLLISYICSKYEIINLSKIIVSYLFEKQRYEDTYISDKFPVVYAPVQLYFMEDLNVTVPQENVLETFSQEIKDCVVLDELKYTQEVLPLDDQVLITNIKNKLLSEMLLNYKSEYVKKMENISINCNDIFLKNKLKLVKQFEEEKKNKLSELDSFFNQEEIKRKEALEFREEKETQELNLKMEGIEAKLRSELEKKRVFEFKKIDIEIQKKLDGETVKVNRILEDSKNRAHIAFKNEIETFTKTAYSNLEEQIKETREQKLKEIESELKDIRDSKLEQINEGHLTEKKRLEDLLTELEAFKRHEIESLHQTEYLERFSSSLLEIQTHLETVKHDKLKQLEEELNNTKEIMYKNLRRDERFKIKESDNTIKLYEQNALEKADEHIKELVAEKLKTEEKHMENELRIVRNTKIKQIEEEEKTRIKEESATIKEELINQMNVQLDALKLIEYDKIKLEINAKLDMVYEEGLKQKQNLLLMRESHLIEKQDAMLEELKTKHMEEFEKMIRVKITERNTELQDYKTNQLKEINVFLEKYKTNELAKFELSKQLQYNDLVELKREKEKEIDSELSKKRQTKLKEIKNEIEQQKQKLNEELENVYQEKLRLKNKEQEKQFSAQLQEKLDTFEKENEIHISKLLSSSKRQYEEYLEETNKEKNALEKTIIENHNKQLKDLEEEYQIKVGFHKSFLKETIKDERQKLLSSEKDCIEDQLKAYKHQRLGDIEKEIMKEICEVKDQKVLSMEKDILKIKETKMEELNSELSEWKKTQEEILRKRFQTLYSDLKSFE